MSSTTVLEELMAMISTVREIVGQVHISMSGMLEVIDAEKQALSLHSISVMEDAAQKKRQLVDAIEYGFSTFESIAKRSVSDFGAPKQSELLTLRGWVKWMRTAIAAHDDAALPRQIAEHQISKLHVAVEELLSTRRRIDPQLQQNKYLVEKCLRNYQLSLRFWVNVSDKTAETYGPTGALHDKRPKSFLTVKA